MSSFVSIGNKADVSPNDLLCYWDEDERTEVVLLYIESFGNPRRFANLVRRIGRRKPIVVVKSGRSAAGRRAASSHTGALLASSDTTVDALLSQVGVTRTDTLEEMFDVATLFANQPLPKGRNVAILTNAGGLGIQCADTCEARGLVVRELSPETVAELRSFLPAAAGVSNPVDMIASATAEDYGRAIRVIAADPSIDSLIVIYIPPLEVDAPAVARQIVDAIGSIDGRVTVLTCFMSAQGVPEALSAPGVRIPSYAFPEHAAIALAHAVDPQRVEGEAGWIGSAVSGHSQGRGRCRDRRCARAGRGVAPTGRDRAVVRLLRRADGAHVPRETPRRTRPRWRRTSVALSC